MAAPVPGPTPVMIASGFMAQASLNDDNHSNVDRGVLKSTKCHHCLWSRHHTIAMQCRCQPPAWLRASLLRRLRLDWRRRLGRLAELDDTVSQRDCLGPVRDIDSP